VVSRFYTKLHVTWYYNTFLVQLGKKSITRPLSEDHLREEILTVLPGTSPEVLIFRYETYVTTLLCLQALFKLTHWDLNYSYK